MRALLIKAGRTGLLVALVSFVLTALNPWGLNEISGDASQDVIQRLTVDAYPVGGGKPLGERGQDLITVVSIDEAGVIALADAGWTGWPPGLDNLATMIRDVALNSGATRATQDKDFQFRGARAVFADFWVDGPVELQPDEAQTQQHIAFQAFIDNLAEVTAANVWRAAPECRTDAAIQIACIIVAGGVPVIMAEARGRATLARVGLSPVARDATNAARLGSAVVLSPITVDERGADMIQVRGEGTGRFSLSPPAALWLASCLSRVNEGETCSLEAAPRMLLRARQAIAKASVADPAKPLPPMEPYNALVPLRVLWPDPLLAIWTGRRPDHQLRLENQTSSSSAPKCRSRTPWMDRLMMAMSGRMADRGPDRACMPQRMIEYDRLVWGAGLPQEDNDLLLKDRLVLIGGHFDGPDWIRSPVHGRVPGVHWHAMALDNLIEKEGAYRRADPGLWTMSTLWEAVITFLIATLIAFLIGIAEARHSATAPKNRWGHPLVLIAIGTAVCLTSAAVILIIQHVVWSRWPINWVASLSVCVGAVATLVEGATSGRLATRLRKSVRDPLTRLGEILWSRLRPARPTPTGIGASGLIPPTEAVSTDPPQNRAP